MEKELVAGSHQENSDSDEERNNWSDKESGSQTAYERSQMDEGEVVKASDEEDTDSDGGDVTTSEEESDSETESERRK